MAALARWVGVGVLAAHGFWRRQRVRAARWDEHDAGHRHGDLRRRPTRGSTWRSSTWPVEAISEDDLAGDDRAPRGRARRRRPRLEPMPAEPQRPRTTPCRRLCCATSFRTTRTRSTPARSASVLHASRRVPGLPRADRVAAQPRGQCCVSRERVQVPCASDADCTAAPDGVCPPATGTISTCLLSNGGVAIRRDGDSAVMPARSCTSDARMHGAHPAGIARS